MIKSCILIGITRQQQKRVEHGLKADFFIIVMLTRRCKQALCLHSELLYFLKYETLSAYLTPAIFACHVSE